MRKCKVIADLLSPHGLSLSVRQGARLYPPALSAVFTLAENLGCAVGSQASLVAPIFLGPRSNSFR